MMEIITANTALKEPDSSIAPHIFLWACQVAALISPPFPGRRGVFATLIISLAIYCNLHPHFTNDMGLAQPFSIAWSFYLSTLATLLRGSSSGPEDRFWRIGNPAKEARAYAAFGWSKIRWAFALLVNLRGIGWNHQVKNVPKPPRTGRSRFLVEQLVRFVVFLSVGDLLYELHRRMNFTSLDGTVSSIDSKYMTLRHPVLHWRLARAFVLGALPFCMISMQSAQLSFVTVLLGLNKPQDWPSTFGSFEDTRTVRLFWGSFWHQSIRHTLTSFTDMFCDMSRIPRGTNLSSYTKLYLAFLISGTFHALGQLHLPRPSNITAAECTMGFIYFFMSQAIAITLEDFVIWLGCSSGLMPESPRAKRCIKWLGRTWVFLFILWTLPFVGDIILKVRVGTGSLLPFPLWRPVVEAWIPIASPVVDSRNGKLA
ncbi:hypothetical protein PFICI_09682 [Pestalotiopsis fici W106-1]|uniref:Wax synthase domain-containing protein n=1 Tax=Pestalotiopsis fici (strain W106-1 / CGMCC3.15140) TaxID=1229662 RepID=W3WUV8_PESFW|nr:uncharacterized protein PFICI_09682 [Pestalotiopsis fici W106-1]ETS77620.1 hypothetical protein PFICI_09682 [Pestalotiopsis fici W106-1]